MEERIASLYEVVNVIYFHFLKVVDEEGQPVVGARALVGYMGKPLPGQVIEDSRDLEREIAGTTGENGVFTASHSDESFDLGIDVQKSGYYSTHRGYDLTSPQSNRNPTFTVVLKKVEKPIPMYAKWVNLGMPAFDKPVGLDLLIGDWVAPYGKGTNTDIIFTFHTDKRSEFDWDSKLVVNFPNSGDGIQEFYVSDMENGSGLRSAHEAPANGYQPQWVQTMSCRPHRGGYSGNRDENRNYYFRIRAGSANGPLYGKIYGDFMQFTYYVDPTPSDRNIEFDPKHNLLKPQFGEPKVTAP